MPEGALEIMEAQEKVEEVEAAAIMVVVEEQEDLKDVVMQAEGEEEVLQFL